MSFQWKDHNSIWKGEGIYHLTSHRNIDRASNVYIQEVLLPTHINHKNNYIMKKQFQKSSPLARSAIVITPRNDGHRSVDLFSHCKKSHGLICNFSHKLHNISCIFCNFVAKLYTCVKRCSCR